MTITRETYLMGREKLAPITPAMDKNVTLVLTRVNPFLKRIGFEPGVSSGYRPQAVNSSPLVKGATLSAHLTCEAIDLSDPTQMLKTCIALHPRADKDLVEWISFHPELRQKFTKLLDVNPTMAQTIRYAYNSDKCLLEEFNLHMEHPESTLGKNTGWVHLQVRKTSDRVFFPTDAALRFWNNKVATGVKK
jgi:hypothetical protein